MSTGSVGAFVRARRLAKGWSQKRLGDEIGADRTYVIQIENGQRKWPEKYIPALAKALDVSEEDLARAAERIVATRAPLRSHDGGALFPAGGPAARVVDLMMAMSEDEIAHILATAEFVTTHRERDVSSG